ncbi:MAG: hypothetical protein HFH02_10580 [Dorea sp.]|nr:hypothetical protein [Dorea sp.]
MNAIVKGFNGLDFNALKGFTPPRERVVERSKNTFGIDLIGVYPTNGRVHIYGGCLFSGGGYGQEIHIKYDESSTEENPVIKAWGIDSKGNDYNKRIYVNEIDPRNASPVEMKALEEHLRRQGDTLIESCEGWRMGTIIWSLGKYDVNEKTDFVQYMKQDGAASNNQKEVVKARLCAERYLFYYKQNEGKRK